MRVNRWTNQSLPQTLQISIFLLYFQAVSGILGHHRAAARHRPYSFRLTTWAAPPGVANVIQLVASVAYVAAGALIANEERRGWYLGIVKAVGGVLIPLQALGPGGVLSQGYVITWAFDIALAVALLHTQSREYQKIWFK